VHRYVARYALAVLAASAVVLMAGCSGSGGASPTVPSLSQGAAESVFAAVLRACQTLLTQADLNPGNEPPAPPQLVQAGVRAAECLRAHGLPNIQDPSARSPYTPGHGFGMTRSEMPAGGKASPVWQHARQACEAQVTAEIQASTLASLGDDG